MKSIVSKPKELFHASSDLKFSCDEDDDCPFVELMTVDPTSETCDVETDVLAESLPASKVASLVATYKIDIYITNFISYCHYKQLNYFL